MTISELVTYSVVEYLSSRHSVSLETRKEHPIYGNCRNWIDVVVSWCWKLNPGLLPEQPV